MNFKRNETNSDIVQQFLNKNRCRLGRVFDLGAKCHGFKSYYPYILLLLWAVRKDSLRDQLNKIRHNFSLLHSNVCKTH